MGELPVYLLSEDEWSHMLLLYDSAIKEISTKIEILNNEFKISHQYNPIEHISSRLKSMDSIARKLRKRNIELNVNNVMTYVNDVAGIRIICSFTSDIYRIAEAIQRQNDIEIIKIKDYIKNPKENGYTSYHMIVTIPIFLSDRVVKTKVEIQIRTIAMDFWASLEHKIYYKFEGNAPHGIRAELKECADIVTFLDKKMFAINEYVKEYAKSGTVDGMTVEGREVVSETDADFETDERSDSEIYAGSDSKSYAGSDPKSYAGSDSKSYAGSDSKSYAGSDSKIYTGYDSESDARQDLDKMQDFGVGPDNVYENENSLNGNKEIDNRYTESDKNRDVSASKSRKNNAGRAGKKRRLWK